MEVVYLLASFAIAVASPEIYDPQMFLENGCPRPEAIKNGNFLLAPGHDRVQFICDEGYMEVGYMFSSCKHGKWDQEAPLCVATGCKTIETMRHGYIQLSYGSAIARFRCDEGHVMKGPEVIVCDGSQWNGTQPECIDPLAYKRGGNTKNDYHRKSNTASPENRKYGLLKSHEDWLQESDYTCIEKLEVVAPPSVMHASPFTKWILLEGRPRLYTVYRCKWGFVSVGENKNLYCQNRQWVGPRPKCVHAAGQDDTYVHFQGDQPRPDSSSSHNDWLSYADYSCLTSDGDITAPDVAHAQRNAMSTALDGKPHLFVEYVCQDGFELQKPTKKFMYCHQKTWLGEEPHCVPAFNRHHHSSGNDNSYSKGSFVSPLESHIEKEVTCDESHCEQMCVVQNNKATCSCTRGYQLNIDGLTCADKDECAIKNGGCHHACLNTLGSYKCSCHNGYRLLSDGHTCRPRRMRYGRPRRPNRA